MVTAKMTNIRYVSHSLRQVSLVVRTKKNNKTVLELGSSGECPRLFLDCDPYSSGCARLMKSCIGHWLTVVLDCSEFNCVQTLCWLPCEVNGGRSSSPGIFCNCQVSRWELHVCRSRELTL